MFSAEVAGSSRSRLLLHDVEQRMQEVEREHQRPDDERARRVETAAAESSQWPEVRRNSNCGMR